VTKPVRVDALGSVALGACRLSSGAERRLRHARLLISSSSRRVLSRPTGQDMIRPLHSVPGARDAQTGAPVMVRPTLDHPTLGAILDAWPMPPTVLTALPVRAVPTSGGRQNHRDYQDLGANDVIYRWGLWFEQSLAVYYTGHLEEAREANARVLSEPSAPDPWRSQAQANEAWRANSASSCAREAGGGHGEANGKGQRAAERCRPIML
jgi:hypothetical protein